MHRQTHIASCQLIFQTFPWGFSNMEDGNTQFNLTRIADEMTGGAADSTWKS